MFLLPACYLEFSSPSGHTRSSPGYIYNLPSTSGPVGDVRKTLVLHPTSPVGDVRKLPVLPPTFLHSGACVTPIPINADPPNPRDEQYASNSSHAVALDGTDTVTDVNTLFAQMDLKPEV